MHDSDVSALVVASEKRDEVGVFEFETEQETDSLNRVVASVYEVSYHYVLCAGHLSSDSEHLQHIIKLPMNIAGDHHG